MSTVHIVRNQAGHYWGRGKRWVDGRETAKVAAWPHRDEAVNTVFELSSKDIDLRCEVMVLNLEDGKLPKLEISEIPLPDDDNGQLPLEDASGADHDEQIHEPQSDTALSAGDQAEATPNMSMSSQETTQ